MEPVQGFVVVLCVQSNPAQIQKVARLQKPVVLLPGDFQAFPERIFGIRENKPLPGVVWMFAT